jgi:hypothetical protein
VSVGEKKVDRQIRSRKGARQRPNESAAVLVAGLNKLIKIVNQSRRNVGIPVVHRPTADSRPHGVDQLVAEERFLSEVNGPEPHRRDSRLNVGVAGHH